MAAILTHATSLWHSATVDLRSIFNCVTSGGSSCLYKHDPVSGLMFLFLCWTSYCFIWSEICRNVSKVDQIWSITPFFYCWYLQFYYAANNGGAYHERLLVICLLTTTWGLRLTYNFWRRGGYGNLIQHEEDYRWPILRKKIGSPVLFFLFNLSFIASYQNFILLCIAFPAHGVMIGPSSCDYKDYIVAAMFVGFLIMESVADNQHLKFHEKKYAVNASERKVHPDSDVRDGFYQSGLFSFCRHPNYFAEQSMWVCVYLFSLTKTEIEGTADLLNGYALGIFLLITLFQGSMGFSEGITASKYPKYKEFQKSTSQCLPWFPAKKGKRA